jgi:hypothetical protein
MVVAIELVDRQAIGAPASVELPLEGPLVAGERAPIDMDLPAPAVNPLAVEPSGMEAIPFLESYWGEQWPAVRQQLIRRGYDVERLGPIQPWEEARKIKRGYFQFDEPSRMLMNFSREMRWFDWEYTYRGEVRRTLSNHFVTKASNLVRLSKNARAAQLDSAAVARIEAEVEPLNVQLEGEILDYFEQLGPVVLAKYDAGQIQREPIALPPATREDLRRDIFYGASVGGSGWQIVLNLTREEAPNLAAWHDSIEELREKRDHEVRRLVAEELALLE